MAKQIPISGGKFFALVDDSDFELVSKYKWNCLIVNDGFKVYAQRTTEPRVLMHKFIMGYHQTKLQVDHINHDGLDNQRNNLRVITRSQNQRNRRPSRYGTSKYLGVSIETRGRKFKAQITIGQGKSKYLGRFENEIDAAKAYNEAAKMYHGEFANLNTL